MKDDRHIDDRADDAYDSWRQRLLDAREEGRQAGTANDPASKCPYLAFEPEYNQWNEGRLETLPANNRRAA